MYLLTFLCLNVVAVLVYRICVIFPQEERMVPPRGHRDRVSHRHSGQFLSHAWRHVLLSSNLPRYDVIIGGKFTSVCNDVVIHKDCTCSLQWCCFSRQSSWTINLGFTNILRSSVGFEYISNCILLERCIDLPINQSISFYTYRGWPETIIYNFDFQEREM